MLELSFILFRILKIENLCDKYGWCNLLKIQGILVSHFFQESDSVIYMTGNKGDKPRLDRSRDSFKQNIFITIRETVTE
jgi:hypothetical protein